jgi:hypothetical protein
MRASPTQTSNHPFIKLICKYSDGAHHVINQIDMCNGDDDFEREMCPWAISNYFGDQVPTQMV